MSKITITLPAHSSAALPLEISELARRWGIGQPELEQGSGSNEYITIHRGDRRILLPHHRLSVNISHWYEEAKGLLASLPSSNEVLADPEGSISGLFESVEEGTWSAKADLPAIFYGLLTRREELLSDERDHHGRWKPESSLLEDWLDIPLIDLLARGFGEIVARTLGIAPPDAEPSWRFAMTFDVDSAGPQLRALPRVAVRSLASSGPRGAMRAVGRGIASALLPRTDPSLTFEAIADRLEDMDLRGLFFVQALYRSRWDDYELNREPVLIRTMRRLRARGHEIGLHGSYATADHGPRFIHSQRECLSKLLGGPVERYRAHYLRTKTPDEQSRCLAPAGITEDWTLGYSTREGFRLGTAHPVETTSGVTLYPLHVMDVTLRFHRKYSAEVALAASIRLLSRIKAVGGTATILWHPHNLNGPLWPFPWTEVPWELALWARENGGQDAIA